MSCCVFQPTRPRRARPADGRASDSALVSTHAPTQGATLSSSIVILYSCFNPRAHAGRDRGSEFKRLGVQFQPTRPRRARLRTGRLEHLRTKFQPTRPRRARRTLLRISCRSSSFNPRAHAGRDVAIGDINTVKQVSTHAPTQGATRGSVFKRLGVQFQPTRPRRARPC